MFFVWEYVGVSPTFITTTTTTTIPITLPPHPGYSGAAVGPSPSLWSLADLFSNWTAQQADVVLLHVGTNDIWAGATCNAHVSVALSPAFLIVCIPSYIRALFTCDFR